MVDHIVYDFFGTVIHVGDRAIMVKKQGHSSFFQKVTIEAIRDDKYGNVVKIIADGNTVSGWTRSSRLITQGNLKTQI